MGHIAGGEHRGMKHPCLFGLGKKAHDAPQTEFLFPCGVSEGYPKGIALRLDRCDQGVAHFKVSQKRGTGQTLALALQKRQPGFGKLIPRPEDRRHQGLGVAFPQQSERGAVVIGSRREGVILARKFHDALGFALDHGSLRRVASRRDGPTFSLDIAIGKRFSDKQRFGFIRWTGLDAIRRQIEKIPGHFRSVCTVFLGTRRTEKQETKHRARREHEEQTEPEDPKALVR